MCAAVSVFAFLASFFARYKLGPGARDHLCPIVKLAKAYADPTAGPGNKSVSVTFGHCGHGEKIDYDSNAFQTHRACGEAFVETFDV